MGLHHIVIQRLQELNLKVGIIETSTNGMISSNFAVYDNYAKVYQFGFIFNDLSLAWKFDLDTTNFICKNNARKLAKYFHDEYDCDCVLSVVSTSNDLNLKEIPNLQIDEKMKDNPNGHAFISIYVVDQFNDYELQFKSYNELQDRITITNKAINTLLSVLLTLH